MAWKEKKMVSYTFSYVLPALTGMSSNFQEKMVVGWSDAAGAARLRNKFVPLYFRNSASQTFLNRVVLISLRIPHSSSALSFQNICCS